MLTRSDPRVRRALDQISQSIEAAQSRTQEGLYAFTRTYVDPCLTSTSSCLHSCLPSCFPVPEARRRMRGQTRAAAEFSFDFYDDWEQDESDALLGIDGGGGQDCATMDYGTRQTLARKKTGLEEADAKIVPSSSYFGFLHRLPFPKARGLKYHPSIADLQDHPTTHRFPSTAEETTPLMDDSDADADADASAASPIPTRQHKRSRSSTAGSGHTSSSLSSRGDIFPSEDEMDDAVPLDDEFALSLERRSTGHTAAGETSSRNSRDDLHGQQRNMSRVSIRTISSKGSARSRKKPDRLQQSDEHHHRPPPSSTVHLTAEEQEEVVMEPQHSQSPPTSSLHRGSSAYASPQTASPLPTSSSAHLQLTRPMPDLANAGMDISADSEPLSIIPQASPIPEPPITTSNPHPTSPTSSQTPPPSSFNPAALPRFS
jgi:hypothetical protein